VFNFDEFKPGGLHEKNVVATRILGNLSIFLKTGGHPENPGYLVENVMSRVRGTMHLDVFNKA
jgi:hypothetical protein